MQKEIKAKVAVFIALLSTFFIGYLVFCQYNFLSERGNDSGINQEPVENIAWKEKISEDYWKLYKQDNFSFFIPVDWKQGNLKEVVVSEKDESKKLIIDIQRIEDINNGRGLRDLAQQGKIKEYEMRLCQGMGNAPCPGTFSNFKEFYIEDGKGVRYSFLDGETNIERLAVIKKDKVYHFWFQVNDSKLDAESVELFDTIMRTLKID